MILVDDRAGSNDLVEPLRRLNVPVEMTRLDTGDVCFSGRGPAGKVLSIGVERKRLDSSDFVSSMRSGRLAGEQLPKMLGPDGAFDHAWLIVEGQWKTDKFGRLVVHTHTKRGWTWKVVPGDVKSSEMEKHLLTLELVGGLHVRFTESRDATVHCLVDLYRWWTDKDLDRHTSHIQVHRPLGFLRLNDTVETLSRFPGLGLAKAQAAATKFHSVRRASNASVDEWAHLSVGNKNLGYKTAQRIVDWVVDGD